MTMHESSSSFWRFTGRVFWLRRGRIRSNNSILSWCILNLRSVLVTTSVRGVSWVNETSLLFNSCCWRWIQLNRSVEKWIASTWWSFKKLANLVQKSQRQSRLVWTDHVGACWVSCSRVVTHWDIREVRAVLLLSFMVSHSSMTPGTNIMRDNNSVAWRLQHPTACLHNVAHTWS